MHVCVCVCVLPSPRQVDLPQHMCIDDGACFRENHDETLALLANKGGMSLRIMSWLMSQSIAPAAPPSIEFISSGWAHAKSKGALEDVAPETEGGDDEALAPTPQKALEALPSAGPQLTLVDVTTPPPKRARAVASPAAIGDSNGVLEI